jgi:hypothetical protein
MQLDETADRDTAEADPSTPKDILITFTFAPKKSTTNISSDF